MGRLAQVDRPPVTGDPPIEEPVTSYDTLGRVWRILNPGGSSTRIAYDGGGRRTQVRDALGRITEYVYYPADGRLWKIRDAVPPPQGPGETVFGYDLMSNLTSITDARQRTTRFTIDDFNRVQAVCYHPGDPCTRYDHFTHDGTGRVNQKTDRRGVTTTYTYDGLGRLTGKTYSDGTSPAVFRYDEGDASQKARLTQSRAYDSFGNPLVGGDQDGYAYTGREWDTETGLYYYRARYYDPNVGRFSSQDPLGFVVDVNFYPYVFSNPIRFRDPFGLDVQQCTRRMTGPMGRLTDNPHVLVASTNTGEGAGLGPGNPADLYADMWRHPTEPRTRGLIEWERPYDRCGRPRTGYACSTVSRDPKVENCVLRKLAQATKNPPDYVLGAYQCDHFATDIVTQCENETR